MKRLLKKIIVIGLVVGGGYLIWEQRHYIAGISNSNFRIRGTWYVYEMDRKGFEPYYFSERIITKDNLEWGSFEIPHNDVIEVMVGDTFYSYDLSFPDEDTMVWSEDRGGTLVKVREWKR